MRNLTAISSLVPSALTAGVTLLLALSVLVLSAVLPAAAQTTQWNGSQSSDWFDPANWSNGVPDAGTEARIAWFGGSSPVLTSGTTIRRLNMGSNNQTLTIVQGAELNILQDVAIGTSGTLNVGNGSVVVNGASTVGGGITVDDGDISFLANLTMNGSAVFTVQTGTVNIGDPGPPVVSANFTQSGGSTFNLNQGTLNIYGVSEFTGGGTFNAGSGEINLSGDIKFNGGSDFNSDESTVNISGEVTISTNSGQSANFYNLNISDEAQSQPRSM